MVDSWRRDIHVGTFYDRWFRLALPEIGPGESLLRTYVSWHVVGTHRAATEPLFTGIELRSGEIGTLTPPPDPMASDLGLPGEWLALEFHAPDGSPDMDTITSRIVWPRDGFRIWDIKANRKAASGTRIVPFFVWALPQESFGLIAPRLTVSMLVRTP